MLETDLSKFDSNSVLIFNHVPKCAGSTINRIINENVSNRIRPSNHAFINDITGRQQSGTLFDAGPLVINGHNAAGTHSLFDDSVKCFYMTTFRHPISIIRSWYHYSKSLLSFNGSFDDFIVGANNATLRAYADIPGGSPDTIANYAYVGFVEELDDFIEVLCKTLNIELAQYQSVNVSRKKNDESLDKYNEYLQDFLKDDMALYARAYDAFGRDPGGSKPAFVHLPPQVNKDTDAFLHEERTSSQAVRYENTLQNEKHNRLHNDAHNVDNVAISMPSSSVLHDLAYKQPGELARLLLNSYPLTDRDALSVDALGFFHATLAHCLFQLGKTGLAEAHLSETFRHVSTEPVLRKCLVKARLVSPDSVAKWMNSLQFKPFLSSALAEELLTFDPQVLSQLTAFDEPELRRTARANAQSRKRIIQGRYTDELLPLTGLDPDSNYLIARAAPANAVTTLLDSGFYGSGDPWLMLQKNILHQFTGHKAIPIKNGNFYCTDQVVSQVQEQIGQQDGLAIIICCRDLNFYSFKEFLNLAKKLRASEVFLYPYLNVYLQQEDRFVIKTN